jgi:hypothetical protein
MDEIILDPHKFVDPASKAYYLLANDQWTLPIDNLTHDGTKIYNMLDTNFNSLAHGTIINHEHIITNSGIWIANKESVYYNESDCGVALHTWNNISIRGEILDDTPQNSNDNYIITSPVIFYGNDWCVTNTGSIYLLK